MHQTTDVRRRTSSAESTKKQIKVAAWFEIASIKWKAAIPTLHKSYGTLFGSLCQRWDVRFLYDSFLFFERLHLCKKKENTYFDRFTSTHNKSINAISRFRFLFHGSGSYLTVPPSYLTVPCPLFHGSKLSNCLLFPLATIDFVQVS